MSPAATIVTSDIPPPVARPYFGRVATLATMHGKEAAIAPIFRERLGLTVATAPAIETDALGTFTGEIARAGTIRDAALAKAKLGMVAAGASIGIASEGSYGPHPHIPFVAGGVEMMALVDDERGLVVTERLIEHNPVYAHIVTAQIERCSDFLTRVGFPDHALIVRANDAHRDGRSVYKGVRTRTALAAAIADCASGSRDGRAFVQTDMRAHMNPTRMATLRRLAALLCDRIAAACPACSSPGYGRIGQDTGLPCRGCGLPSGLIQRQVFGCSVCAHRETRARPDGRGNADPGECQHCNP